MIMEREKVPPRVFAETIGVQQSTLSHILNDRNKPSLEAVSYTHLDVYKRQVLLTADNNIPEQFGNIIIRCEQDGAMLRLKDIARIDLGSASYSVCLLYTSRRLWRDCF